MIRNILHLYPNLKIIHDNIVDDQKQKFEDFLINEFKIEKRPLDQILKKTCYPANYKLEIYPSKPKK